jgi:hypothetical protein
MSEKFKTPIDAWTFLVAHGGIEVHGRDEILTEQLQTRLEPQASDIETALRGVSMEVFLNAFFGLLGPFVRIMRDLLEYFERADAKQGPGQWVLILGKDKDKLQINLDHFRQWLKLFDKQAAHHSVPLLEYSKIWGLQSAFRSLPDRRQRILEPPSFALERDVAAWLEAYERTSWLPLPNVVARTASRRGSIGEYATLVHEIASAVSSVVPNYETLNGNLSRIREEAPPDIAEYARIEHDRWVKTNVLNLISFDHANHSLRSLVEKDLEAMLKDAPRRPARFQFQMESLTEALSLPIWKKRYELYSAWIFTRFLAALPGHDIELHHEDGCLRFAFRETLLATVRSLPAPLYVYAEKRVEAHNLRGHGRVKAIQPDYSAWTEGNKECKLAIECKHYKRASTTNFHDALLDYSNNLAKAQVLLVNYGPIHAALLAMTAAGGDDGRRFCWGNVNPEFPAQVAAFEQAVRKAVGEPRSQAPTGHEAKGAVFVIDVSSSMESVLKASEVQRYILDLVGHWAPVHLAAVDDEERGIFEPNAEGLKALLEASPFGATALHAPAKQLAKTYSEVLVLTDEDGLSTLGSDVELLGKGPPPSSSSANRAIFLSNDGSVILGSAGSAGPLRFARLRPNT